MSLFDKKNLRPAASEIDAAFEGMATDPEYQELAKQLNDPRTDGAQAMSEPTKESLELAHRQETLDLSYEIDKECYKVFPSRSVDSITSSFSISKCQDILDGFASKLRREERQKAEKLAEALRGNPSLADFLRWLGSRLIFTYKENQNLDFVQACFERADKLEAALSARKEQG